MRSVSAILLASDFVIMLSFLLPVVHAQAAVTGGTAIGDIGLKFLAAAVAFGAAAAGAGYGIGHSGAAMMAAVAEKPEVRTIGIIVVALAEAIAIYGFVIAIIILGSAA